MYPQQPAKINVNVTHLSVIDLVKLPGAMCHLTVINAFVTIRKHTDMELLGI